MIGKTNANKKVQDLMKRLINAQDFNGLEVLEHLYLRPFLDAKFFLRVREYAELENGVVPSSGGTIMT